MFKSQQYRAKAIEYGELVKTSTDPAKSREFRKLERRFASLADNEQVLADDHNSAVHVSNHDQSCGAALAFHAMGHLIDNAATGGLRHRWVHGQVAGDSSAPWTDRSVSAQAQG